LTVPACIAEYAVGLAANKKLLVGVLVLCVAAPSRARAADVELTGTMAFQGYEVASPWGYDVERRRLLGTLGFSLYHL
jgi:hypothetical protein